MPRPATVTSTGRTRLVPEHPHKRVGKRTWDRLVGIDGYHVTGLWAGGDIYIASGASVYIDAFTVANGLNNTDHSGPNGRTENIAGAYVVQAC